MTMRHFASHLLSCLAVALLALVLVCGLCPAQARAEGAQPVARNALFYVSTFDAADLPDDLASISTAGSNYSSVIRVSQALVIEDGAVVYDPQGLGPDILQATPSQEEVVQACDAKGIDFDPTRDQVVWYVAKRELDGWHVDGAILYGSDDDDFGEGESGEPAGDDPSADHLSGEDPSTDDPADGPSGDDPADNPETDGPSGNDPADDDSGEGESGEPAGDKPSSLDPEDGPSGDEPADDPATDDPSVTPRPVPGTTESSEPGPVSVPGTSNSHAPKKLPAPVKPDVAPAGPLALDAPEPVDALVVAEEPEDDAPEAEACAAANPQPADSQQDDAAEMTRLTAAAGTSAVVGAGALGAAALALLRTLRSLRSMSAIRRAFEEGVRR